MNKQVYDQTLLTRLRHQLARGLELPKSLLGIMTPEQQLRSDLLLDRNLGYVIVCIHRSLKCRNQGQKMSGRHPIDLPLIYHRCRWLVTVNDHNSIEYSIQPHSLAHNTQNHTHEHSIELHCIEQIEIDFRLI